MPRSWHLFLPTLLDVCSVMIFLISFFRNHTLPIALAIMYTCILESCSCWKTLRYESFDLKVMYIFKKVIDDYHGIARWITWNNMDDSIRVNVHLLLPQVLKSQESYWAVKYFYVNRTTRLIIAGDVKN